VDGEGDSRSYPAFPHLSGRPGKWLQTDTVATSSDPSWRTAAAIMARFHAMLLTLYPMVILDPSMLKDKY
jgi:hypothetical protein